MKWQVASLESSSGCELCVSESWLQLESKSIQKVFLKTMTCSPSMPAYPASVIKWMIETYSGVRVTSVIGEPSSDRNHTLPEEAPGEALNIINCVEYPPPLATCGNTISELVEAPSGEDGVAVNKKSPLSL